MLIKLYLCFPRPWMLLHQFTPSNNCSSYFLVAKNKLNSNIAGSFIWLTIKKGQKLVVYPAFHTTH